MEFKFVQDAKSYYQDGWALYFTAEVKDVEEAKTGFGVGSKYLEENDPKRFWSQAYFIEAYEGNFDGQDGVYVKVGMPYLD